MLASDQVSTVSRILSSLSDHDIDKLIDKHIDDMMGEGRNLSSLSDHEMDKLIDKLIDKHIDDMMSETQSSSGSKMLRRKI